MRRGGVIARRRASAPFLLIASAGVIALSPSLSAQATVPAARSDRPVRFSWPTFATGVVTSILAHELTHVAVALAVGGRPSLGFDQGRPVIHSGIGPNQSTKAFAFSASGMSMQLVIDEVLLNWPRSGGIARELERGLLAGGVGTVAFYLTLGRSARVGDLQQMVTHSGLSAWGVTAIFGGVAASEVVRMALKQRYAHFFAGPARGGRVVVGAAVEF